MKNTLSDLNNHLFLELERLNDEDLTKEQLETETKRADSVVKVASAIIDNAKTVLAAEKYKTEYGITENLKMLDA